MRGAPACCSPARDAEGRPARPLYVVAEKIAAPHEDVPAELARARHHRLPLRHDRQWRAGRHRRASAASTGSGTTSRARTRRSRSSPTKASATSCAARWHPSSPCSRPSCCASRAPTGARATTPSTRCARRWPRSRPACRCTAPTSSTSRRSRTGATSTGRWRTRARRSRAADLSIFDFVRQSLLGQAIRGRRRRRWRERVRALCDPLPAVQRAGGRQGRRRHRVLPLPRLASLNEVGGDPSLFGMSLRAFHAASLRPRGTLAAHHAGHVDARQQARRGRALPHRRALRDAGGLAAGAAPLGAAEPRAAHEASGRHGALARRRVPALPDPARHPAGGRAGRSRRSLPGATHRALHAQGRARGQGEHELDQPERRLRESAARASCAACSRACSPTRFSTTCARWPRPLAWFGALNSLA